MDRKLTIVGTYELEFDAEVAKGHLENEGIESFIVKDDGGGMIPSLQQTEGVKLVVADEDAREALEILKDIID